MSLATQENLKLMEDMLQLYRRRAEMFEERRRRRRGAAVVLFASLVFAALGAVFLVTVDQPAGPGWLAAFGEAAHLGIASMLVIYAFILIFALILIWGPGHDGASR